MRTGRSISTKVPWKTRKTHPAAVGSGDDLDLWLAFLLETGLLQASSLTYQLCMYILMTRSMLRLAICSGTYLTNYVYPALRKLHLLAYLILVEKILVVTTYPTYFRSSYN